MCGFYYELKLSSFLDARCLNYNTIAKINFNPLTVERKVNALILLVLYILSILTHTSNAKCFRNVTLINFALEVWFSINVQAHAINKLRQ